MLLSLSSVGVLADWQLANEQFAQKDTYSRACVAKRSSRPRSYAVLPVYFLFVSMNFERGTETREREREKDDHMAMKLQARNE